MVSGREIRTRDNDRIVYGRAAAIVGLALVWFTVWTVTSNTLVFGGVNYWLFPWALLSTTAITSFVGWRYFDTVARVYAREVEVMIANDQANPLEFRVASPACLGDIIAYRGSHPSYNKSVAIYMWLCIHRIPNLAGGKTPVALRGHIKLPGDTVARGCAFWLTFGALLFSWPSTRWGRRELYQFGDWGEADCRHCLSVRHDAWRRSRSNLAVGLTN